MRTTEESAKTPEVVYHYTSTAGLLGILSSNELWLGDIEFMNDATELEYARNGVIADLERRAEELWPAARDREEVVDWSRAAIIRGAVGELRRAPGNGANRTFHAYAACFCEDSDLLSQWRGYAGEGGYAIGFRTNSLAANTDRSGASYEGLARVHYGLTAARATLVELTSKIAPHGKAHAGVEGWHELMHHVLPVVTTIKHPSFSEEKEWRLLRLSWGLPPDLAFRVGQLGPLPYINHQLMSDAVSDIVVGPGDHSDVRMAGVLQLIEKLDLHDLSVTPSASPLRY